MRLTQTRSYASNSSMVETRSATAAGDLASMLNRASGNFDEQLGQPRYRVNSVNPGFGDLCIAQVGNRAGRGRSPGRERRS